MNLLLVLNFFVSSFLFLQEQKNTNFIITIDEKIENISNIQLIINNDGGITTINLDYVPGNLSLNKSDFDLIVEASDACELLLKFTYVETCKDNTDYRHYEVAFEKEWLEKAYFILNIYNTDKKKYRKIYEPLPDKNYNYDFKTSDSINGKLIQKKYTKKQRKCFN